MNDTTFYAPSGYAVAEAIKEAFTPDESRFINLIGRLCVHSAGVLDGFLGDIGVDIEPGMTLYETVMNAAFYRHSSFESLHLRRLKAGSPHLEQRACNRTERSISTYMGRMRKSGLLIAIDYTGASMGTLYAPNIEPLWQHLLKSVPAYLSRADMAEAHAAARYHSSHKPNKVWEDARKTWAALKSMPHVMASLIAKFKLLADTKLCPANVSAFMSEVVKIKDKVIAIACTAIEAVSEAVVDVVETAKEGAKMMLADAIKGVQKATTVHRDAKIAKRGAQPLFVIDRKKPVQMRANGDAGLALWNRLIKENDDKYPGYLPEDTKIMRGQMADLLTKLSKDNMTEDDIREWMAALIENWQSPSEFIPRKIIVTKFTKDRSRSWTAEEEIPRMPSFKFFYPRRSEVAASVFASVGAPVVSSKKGKDFLTVKYIRL